MPAKLSTFVILIAAALVKGCLLVVPLHHIASVAFHTGPESLTSYAAWTGVLANALEFYLALSAVSDAVLAVATLLGREASGLQLNYWRPSVAELWASIEGSGRAGKFSAGFATVLGFALLYSSSLTMLAVVGSLLAWTALERWLYARTKLPRFTRCLITLAVWIAIIGLCRTQTFAQGWHLVKALVGQESLTETALLTDARVTMDGYFLAPVFAALMVFVLPTIQGMVQPIRWWKVLPAALIVLVFGAWFGSETARAAMRGRLIRSLAHESSGVHVGRLGWLFDARELDALTGWGPSRAEYSTASASTSEAAESIKAFAAQLKEREVKLLLIPLPMKASIYPEFITGSDPEASEAPLYHAAQPDLYAELAAAGADVQDITDAMLQLKERKKAVFLKQSTLWTPDAMQDLARAIAVHVRKTYPGLVPADPLIVDTKVRDGFAPGDLADRLDAGLAPERVGLTSFATIENDPKSPILVLGDREVNAFDDPALGYVPKDAVAGSRLKAGFAQHLALYLGRSIDAIAVNEGSSTEVRKQLAARTPEEFARKRLVIWLLPARDLAGGPSAGVRWQQLAMPAAVPSPN